MAEKSLQEQRLDLLREAEEITRLVEPMLRRREAVLCRAGAIETLLEPLDPRPSDLIEAGFRAGDGRVFEPGSYRATVRVKAPAWTSVSDRPAAYRTPPPVESGVDASVVITQILEGARRPLHRSEILYRSRVHPLGPLNSNTMSTRLSRDPSFERLRRRPNTPPAYWVLKDWPDDWKRADRIKPEGRVYVDALQQLSKERARLRQLHHETVTMERRLADLRIHATEGDDDAARYQRLESLLRRQLERLSFDMRRTRALVTSLWQATMAAWSALGEEQEKYPPVPAIDQQATDRADDLTLGPDDLDDDPADDEEGEDG